jgi:nitrate/nitrite transporter NarK
MDPYQPPVGTPPPPKKPLKYRPRFGPSGWSLGFGLFVFAVAVLVSASQGQFREWLMFSCLLGAGTASFAAGMEYLPPKRKD